MLATKHTDTFGKVLFVFPTEYFLPLYSDGIAVVLYLSQYENSERADLQRAAFLPRFLPSENVK